MTPIRKTLTAEERSAWQAQVAAAEAERADDAEYFQRAEAAAAEPTFSGQLRRAIHTIHQRGLSLDSLEERAQVDWTTLEPFLVGDATLPSDVIDRLVDVLGMKVQFAEVANAEETDA